MADDKDDWEDLPENFCDEAEGQADYEQKVADGIKSMIADGYSADGIVLGALYLFTIRAIAKLWLNGLTPDDAFEVLIQERFDRSSTSGAQTANGECRKGHVTVVFEPTLLREEMARAPFKVITAYVR